jgi:hypothetical protein
MENLAAPFGIYCGGCKDLGNICKGCISHKGKPYWTLKANMTICNLYDCCINKKQVEHCGLCVEFLCQQFKNTHDTALSPQEVEKELLTRCNDLLHRKEIGTVKWLAEKVGGNKK